MMRAGIEYPDRVLVEVIKPFGSYNVGDQIAPTGMDREDWLHRGFVREVARVIKVEEPRRRGRPRKLTP
jgi:hypothetical protein